MPPRPRPAGSSSSPRPVRRVDPGDGAVRRSSPPRRPLAERDTGRTVADHDRVDDRSSRGRSARQCRRGRLRPRRRRRRLRSRPVPADLDRLRTRSSSGSIRETRVAVGVRDPDRALARATPARRASRPGSLPRSRRCRGVDHADRVRGDAGPARATARVSTHADREPTSAAASSLRRRPARQRRQHAERRRSGLAASANSARRPVFSGGNPRQTSATSW